MPDTIQAVVKLPVAQVCRQNRLGQMRSFRDAALAAIDALRAAGYEQVETVQGVWEMSEDGDQYILQVTGRRGEVAP